MTIPGRATILVCVSRNYFPSKGMYVLVPKCLLRQLVRYSRPVTEFTEEERAAARLWSGQDELPPFAGQIRRRNVRGE